MTSKHSTFENMILIRCQGFDEYMNIMLDEAEEVNTKKKTRKTLGRILLKGDNVTLMMRASSTDA